MIQSPINRWLLDLVTYSFVFWQISLLFARFHRKNQRLTFTERFPMPPSGCLQLWLILNWLFVINTFSILDTASLQIIWNATFLTLLYTSLLNTFLVTTGLFFKCYFKMHNLTSPFSGVKEMCTISLLCLTAKCNYILAISRHLADVLEDFWQTDTHTQTYVCHAGRQQS